MYDKPLCCHCQEKYQDNDFFPGQSKVRGLSSWLRLQNFGNDLKSQGLGNLMYISMFRKHIYSVEGKWMYS